MVKKVSVGIAAVVILLVIIGIGIVNIICNDHFWSASFAQLITPLIALFFAFWATQYKNDQRKAKEHAEGIIVKLQEIVTNDNFCIISAIEDPAAKKKEINGTNRKISNYLAVLEGYAKTLNFSTELGYIKSEFSTYKRTTGEHIADLEYLSKTETDFRRIAENIDSKCEAIILKLYK